MNFKINNTKVGNNSPVYFVADIAANHNGSLKKAKELIKLCSEAGANAAKFQHFKANTIVSDLAFKKMHDHNTHQSSWKKTVFETYSDASIGIEWCKELKKTCEENNIDFFTSTYDLSYVDEVYEYICAYKIGSGDITWLEIIEKIAKKNKPVLLATGASNIEEVKRAVQIIKKHNSQLVLMQCNTNYTGNDEENISNLNLNVLHTFKKMFPELVLGLSDHTLSNLSVISSVSIGAKVIEKHFTDKNDQEGPDHKFSLNPTTWKKMVETTRILEKSLGDGEKKVENNEKSSIIVQRRSVCAKVELKAGQVLNYDNLICLRPKPSGAVCASELDKFIGRKLKIKKLENEPIFNSEIE